MSKIKFFSMFCGALFMAQSLLGQSQLARKAIVHDTLKTIIVYSINNKTDEIIAKIEIKATVSNNTFIHAKAKLLENNLDKLIMVNKLTVKIENGNVILSVLIEDDVGCTIFLTLNKAGNIRSASPNMSVDEADLRFGGVFLDQAQGVFKTESVSLK
jgi:hypothetical protein